jgi:hypothetical protein
MTLILLSLLFVALDTILEARQDYWICKDTRGEYRVAWKLWGNGYAMVLLGGLAFNVNYIAQKPWYLFILLHVTYAFVWWIMHDMALGWFLKKNVFYLGSTGFDAKVFKTFHHGLIFVIFRVILLLFFSGWYIWA